MILPLLAAFLIAGQQCPSNTWINPQDGKCYGLRSDTPGNGRFPAPLKIAGQQQQAPTYEKTVCPQGKPCVTTPQTGKPPFTCDVTGGCNYCKAVEGGSDCVHVPYGGKGDPNDTTRAIAGQQPPLVNLTTDKTIEQQLGCNSHQHAGNTPRGKIACVENAPLKCQKYQHEQKMPAHCANTCLPEAMACTTQCMYMGATDECVDDIHMVSEREWQELMEHIRWIDHIRKEQCPSLSWINGRCIPSCKDDPNGSCKPDLPKEQRK